MVDFGWKLTAATPRKAAFRQRSFSSVFSVNHAGRKNSGRAAHNPPRSIPSATWVFPPEWPNPAEKKQRRRCRNGNATQPLRHRSFAIRQNEKYLRANSGVASPKAAPQPFCGRCIIVRPGAQSCRTKNRGDSANAAWEVDSSEVFRHHCYFSALEVDSRGGKTQATLPKRHGPSIVSPSLVGVPPGR